MRWVRQQSHVWEVPLRLRRGSDESGLGFRRGVAQTLAGFGLPRSGAEATRWMAVGCRTPAPQPKPARTKTECRPNPSCQRVFPGRVPGDRTSGRHMTTAVGEYLYIASPRTHPCLNGHRKDVPLKVGQLAPKPGGGAPHIWTDSGSAGCCTNTDPTGPIYEAEPTHKLPKDRAATQGRLGSCAEVAALIAGTSHQATCSARRAAHRARPTLDSKGFGRHRPDLAQRWRTSLPMYDVEALACLRGQDSRISTKIGGNLPTLCQCCAKIGQLANFVPMLCQNWPKLAKLDRTLTQISQFGPNLAQV